MHAWPSTQAFSSHHVSPAHPLARVPHAYAHLVCCSFPGHSPASGPANTPTSSQEDTQQLTPLCPSQLQRPVPAHLSSALHAALSCHFPVGSKAWHNLLFFSQGTLTSFTTICPYTITFGYKRVGKRSMGTGHYSRKRKEKERD